MLYFRKHYHFISAEELHHALYHGDALPPRSVLLTFDDGYLDHYLHVLPVLESYGIKGCFFPPVCAIRDRAILSVNKIHFILCCAQSTAAVAAFIRDQVDCEAQRNPDVQAAATYENPIDNPYRYDTPEVSYIKCMLQKQLPEAFRDRLIDQLFARFVTQDTRGFADELYLSQAHLAMMQALGHHIGSHGSRHYWLGSLSSEGQLVDISQSRRFLQELGMTTLSICYPYGDYNDETLAIVHKEGFTMGFCTRVGEADLTANPLTLSRWDTNDFPKDRNAQPLPSRRQEQLAV